MTGGYLALLAKCKYTFIDAEHSGSARPASGGSDDSYMWKLRRLHGINGTARPPVEKLCWWVNLLLCLCHSSIQGTNLILFHLQRSSGVRRWVALRKKHTPASVWRTRQHSLTHQMKFQNKRLSCDLQFSSGPEKSEKTFQSVPPAFVMPLWISCLRDKTAERQQEKDSEWFHSTRLNLLWGTFHSHEIGFLVFFSSFFLDLCLIESEWIALDLNRLRNNKAASLCDIMEIFQIQSLRLTNRIQRNWWIRRSELNEQLQSLVYEQFRCRPDSHCTCRALKK